MSDLKAHKILLNWMPPAMLEAPSPSMSILRQYLNIQGFEATVIYWNLKFAEIQSKFLWMEKPVFVNNERLSMLLFFNYLAIKKNDKNAYNHVRATLMTLKPQFLGLKADHFDQHMQQFAQEFESLLDEIILEIVSPDILYYGMSVNLYQWVCSSIIAEKIKQKNQNCTIVIGGIGTESSAIAYLENFDQFDFAIWGEGEIALSRLTTELSENLSLSEKNYDKLINTAFKKDGIIQISNNKKTEYIDLSEIAVRPDFSAFFEQKKQIEFLKDIKNFIPIETSRGCHWKRCHFCYLNTAYKFRWKSVESIADEIRFMIKTVDSQNFNFVDNDLIGGNKNRFLHLLDELIAIKEEYPEFTINLAEIITKGIHSSTIKKMALAGFSGVQIGYESPSHSLLKKIDKKNTFASNLLFIKFAAIYKIGVNGANIITGLLEETNDDILEAINNLHPLRYCLRQGRFRHNMSALAVMHSSPYYEKVKDDLPHWNEQIFANLLPKNYLKAGDVNYDIVERTKNKLNSLWQNFQHIEQYYINSFYEYELFKKEENIIYRERLNGEIINEIEFETSSLDWFILEKGNDSVTSLDDILSSVKQQFEGSFLDVEIINIIEELKSAQLIYATDNYSEIVTIINTQVIL